MACRLSRRTRHVAIGTALSAFLCSPAAAQEVHELTFSTYLPPAFEYVWNPIEQFVDTLERESAGRLRVNVLHSGQLLGGSPTSMLSADLCLAFERGVIDRTPRPVLTGSGAACTRSSTTSRSATSPSPLRFSPSIARRGPPCRRTCSRSSQMRRPSAIASSSRWCTR